MIIISHILLSGTQSILTYLNKWCQSLKVTRQCKKRWSIDSPLRLHKTHQSSLRDLKVLLNYNMSFVLTFLWFTNQPKTLTLEFYINLAKEKISKFQVSDKAIKKDLTMNDLEEVNDHTLASRVDEDKCTQVRDNMSLSKSSIYESVRLRRKLRLQENEEKWPRIVEIVRFFIVTTL